MNERLKPHLINLLFEEYKVSSFLWKLMEFGVTMERLNINNYQIVLDMIGFPADNSFEYDFVPSQYVKTPDSYFSRDWLENVFADIAMQLSENSQIILTESGLKIKAEEDEMIVKRALSIHIDWLFEQWKDLISDK
jgi:hypothetical protein